MHTIKCPNYTSISKNLSSCKVLKDDFGIEFIPSPNRSGGVCGKCINEWKESPPTKDNLTTPMIAVIKTNGKIELPTITERVGNFAASLKEWAFTGFKNVPENEANRRLEICKSNSCGMYNSGVCDACGCLCSAKTLFSHEECPAGLWGKKDLGAEVLNNAPKQGCQSCGGK